MRFSVVMFFEEQSKKTAVQLKANLLYLKRKDVSPKKGHFPISTNYSFIVLTKNVSIVAIFNNTTKGANVSGV
jgi:hypothetical protein